MAWEDYLNADQRDHLESLRRTPPEQLCWCGWHGKGQCYSCGQDPRLANLSAADRIAGCCEVCGGTRWQPDGEVTHTVNCPKRSFPVVDKG